MGHYILYIIISFVVSLACGLACVPAVTGYCVRHGLFDTPNARKVHKKNIPRLGGICFLPSMLLAFALGLAVYGSQFDDWGMVRINTWSYVLLISIGMIYAVGFADDIFGLSAGVKFAVQIVAASLLPAVGLYINNLYGFLGLNELPFAVGAPLTVFVVVFICNAMNLIDGIDGLSGGLSLLALGGFFVCFASEGVWLYCLMIAGLIGVVVAFLYFNVFGREDKRRKVFMGDTGSLTLGFVLAILLVKFSMDNSFVMSPSSEHLILSYTLLIVPVFDVVRVILVRLKHRRPIFDADKNHIHHKLLRAGMGQHGALTVILSLALLFIVLNCLLCDYCDANAIVAIDITIWVLFHVAVNRRIRRCGGTVYLRVEQK